MGKSTHYKTSQDWLEQSSSLLRARPNTTRITTKYSLKPPTSRTATRLPTTTKLGFLILKTYDPDSGATLKYKTTKAAEVGRLLQCLGMLGRNMAGLPEVVVGGKETQGGEEVEGKKGEGENKGGKKKKGRK